MLAHRVMMSGWLDYAAEVMADSPVAWWRLDETTGTTANDAVGTNHGTYSGATLNQSPLINAGKSVLFSGSSSGISVPDNDALSFGAGFALEAWAKTTGTGQVSIFDKSTSGSTWPEYSLQMLSNGTVKCQVRSGNADTPNVTATTTLAVNNGVRHHIVAVFTPSATLKIYVDSVERASVTHSIAASWNSAANLWIGRRINAESFAGNLDEIALYASALSATRVSAHYNAGVA